LADDDIDLEGLLEELESNPNIIIPTQVQFADMAMTFIKLAQVNGLVV